jgi:hypothetical protein
MDKIRQKNVRKESGQLIKKGPLLSESYLVASKKYYGNLNQEGIF